MLSGQVIFRSGRVGERSVKDSEMAQSKIFGNSIVWYEKLWRKRWSSSKRWSGVSSFWEIILNHHAHTHSNRLWNTAEYKESAETRNEFSINMPILFRNVYKIEQSTRSQELPRKNSLLKWSSFFGMFMKSSRVQEVSSYCRTFFYHHGQFSQNLFEVPQSTKSQRLSLASIWAGA